MGNRVEAGHLILQIGEQLGLPERELLSLFAEAPLDFPIYFTKRLPFAVHRFGMIGITLRGSVWLLEKSRESNPVWLLSLIRHEGEHVRQQRAEPILFYLRYLLSWFGNLLTPLPSKNLRQIRKRFGLSHGAYRAIPYEIEAYCAGDLLAEGIRSIHPIC